MTTSLHKLEHIRHNNNVSPEQEDVVIFDLRLKEATSMRYIYRGGPERRVRCCSTVSRKRSSVDFDRREKRKRRSRLHHITGLGFEGKERKI